MTLKERFKHLEAHRPQIEAQIMSACRNATIQAVKTATEMTPPIQDDLKSINTRSSGAKAHWKTDSDINPKKSGSSFKTILANDKEYISYLNDGHRMDRHFVPGLYVNPYSGLLEYDASKDAGMVVGTKTTYVPGIFMKDKAVQVWKDTLKSELADIGEVFE